MAKRANYAALKYTFIVRRADNPWNDVFDFENDLSDFFAAHQFQLEPLQTIEGSGGDRMILLTKIEEIQTLNNKRDANGANQFPKSQKSATIVKKLTENLTHGKTA